MADMEKGAKGGARAWTESEKLSVLFQIIATMGTIPWKEVKIPEGRTIRGVQQMVDKERAKVRLALEADGRDGNDAAGSGTPGRGRKRNAKSAENETDAGASPTKKGKKKSQKANESSSADDENDEITVKSVKNEVKIKPELEDQDEDADDYEV